MELNLSHVNVVKEVLKKGDPAAIQIFKELEKQIKVKEQELKKLNDEHAKKRTQIETEIRNLANQQEELIQKNFIK
jgi:cell division protein FtsB